MSRSAKVSTSEPRRNLRFLAASGGNESGEDPNLVTVHEDSDDAREVQDPTLAEIVTSVRFPHSSFSKILKVHYGCGELFKGF